MTSNGPWATYSSKYRLPPTPPDYQQTYDLSPIQSALDDSYVSYSGRPSQNNRHSYSSRDYVHPRYNQSSKFPSYDSYARNKQAQSTTDYGFGPTQAPSRYPQTHGSLPILPPIQAPDSVPRYTTIQYPHSVPQTKQKEEKPTGGVAQHLDYEMDVMANFVAESCQQLVTRVSATPTAHFRKYVSQILSSTRLPSSTIMLGLFYLQERMKHEHGDLTSSGSLMKMLTVCLLLGSKFLDDNTFQNKSWAEVSNIPVQVLNSMELEWLKAWNWSIHKLMDKGEGFFAWIEYWHHYEEKTQAVQAKEVRRLAPIITQTNRHSVAQQPMLSPEGPIPPQYQQSAQYDTTWARTHLTDYSPPYSGPTTPEYYNNNWHYAAIADVSSRPSWHAQQNLQHGPAFASARSAFAPYYTSPYEQVYQTPTWPSHGSTCPCGVCLKQSGYYTPQTGYHYQSVIG